MMIKRIARTAGFTGLSCALLLTLLQSVWVTPLILQAETYEQAPAAQLEAPVDHAHEDAAARHAHPPPRHGNLKTAGSACCPPPGATWWWPSGSR